MFAGYINVVDGPHVAREPDVVQAWSRRIIEKEEKALSKKFFFEKKEKVWDENKLERWHDATPRKDILLRPLKKNFCYQSKNI
jgi:hypothetical protein